ncbi:hypothetical protein [Amycolatopsis speibonae]|uniref:DUF2746 domain-containing protein n=1 Tax=Amycolatopsis speibonae TaxID=1450224 RepID=A0ABV7P7T2_9PSEU
MNQLVLSLISLLGGAGWIVSLIQVRAKNRRLNTDSVKVLTETATGLVKAVKEELEEAEGDAKKLRSEVKELTRQLAEAHLLADDLNQKLVDTQRRADYYEAEYRRVTGFGNKGT